MAAVVYLAARMLLTLVPGYTLDTQQYADWALKAARHGLPDVYRHSHMDYPPLYAYLLYPAGRIYDRAAPAGSPRITDSRLLSFLIKLPPLLFDLGIAWLLHRTARRAAAPIWGLLLPALYLLNPAVLFATAYWGHPDSVHAGLVLAAFLVLGADRGSPALSGALLALAILMKPIAAPFVPLWLAWSAIRHGPRRTLTGVGAALAVTALVCLPFVPPAAPGLFLERMAANLGVMPFTTCNAHNIWWLVLPWRPAEEPWLGSFTPTHVAFLLFGCLYAALLSRGWRVHRRQSTGLSADQGLALAALVAFGFFMLATHLHENHLFPALVLLLPLLPRIGSGSGNNRRRTLLIAVFAGVSLGLLLNMALHDPNLSALWPAANGGLTPAEIAVGERLFRGPPTATRVAAFLNLGTFLAFATWIFLPRGRGLLARLADPVAPRSAR